MCLCNELRGAGDRPAEPATEAGTCCHYHHGSGRAGKRSSEASRRSAHRQNSMPGLRKGQSAGGETPTTPSRASSKASVGGGAKRGSSSEAEEPMPRFFSEEPAAQKPAMPAERPHTRRNSRVESKLDRVDEIVELCRIAKALKIPQATIKQGADLFKEFGSTQGIPIKDWRMNETQFKKVMCRLTNRRSQNEEIFMQEAFWYADADRSGVLDFIKFVVWLSNNSFSEDLNLDESQKGMRALARKHGVHYALIDRYKRAFDEFDQDSSGGIDPEEFENLIYKCGKVPHKLGLPASRVQQWWRDADKDGNGVVDFEEFLVFQRKYFDEGNSGQASSSSEARRSGFENYYRGIRKHCWT